MLEARSVSYSISGKTIIDDVSLQTMPGELMVIVGSNGAGKSTLLNLLTGELPAEKGQITMNDSLLESICLKQRAKIRAVLPQNASLSFPFKVDEVVMMGRSPHKGVGYEKDHQVVNEVLNIVGASHLKERNYITLSGGERQRVQLARVLVQIWEKVWEKKRTGKSEQPRYLLLDEPTSALDLAHQHNTLNVARKFAHQEGVGVVAVLHDLNLAALYADKIAMMKAGKILQVGSAKSVLNAPLIQQVFNIEVEVIPHPAHQSCPLVIAYAHQ